jgi:ferredoxin
MRVEVDYELCEGNGVCVAHAPEIFDLRDDDRLYLHREDVPPELAERAQAAVTGCPRQALGLVS